MTDPISGPTPDPETVRVTYAELAKARGVSIAAARKLVLRHRWPKQIGNDGLTHALVPVSFMEETGGRDDPPPFDEAVIEAIAKATAVAVTGVLPDLRTVLPTLQEAIASLRVELYEQRDRADRAEARVRELEARRWWQWWR
jgi:hypothetical protein